MAGRTSDVDVILELFGEPFFYHEKTKERLFHQSDSADPTQRRQDPVPVPPQLLERLNKLFLFVVKQFLSSNKDLAGDLCIDRRELSEYQATTCFSFTAPGSNLGPPVKVEVLPMLVDVNGFYITLPRGVPVCYDALSIDFKALTSKHVGMLQVAAAVREMLKRRFRGLSSSIICLAALDAARLWPHGREADNFYECFRVYCTAMLEVITRLQKKLAADSHAQEEAAAGGDAGHLQPPSGHSGEAAVLTFLWEDPLGGRGLLEQLQALAKITDNDLTHRLDSLLGPESGGDYDFDSQQINGRTLRGELVLSHSAPERPRPPLERQEGIAEGEDHVGAEDAAAAEAEESDNAAGASASASAAEEDEDELELEGLTGDELGSELRAGAGAGGGADASKTPTPTSSARGTEPQQQTRMLIGDRRSGASSVPKLAVPAATAAAATAASASPTEATAVPITPPPPHMQMHRIHGLPSSDVDGLPFPSAYPGATAPPPWTPASSGYGTSPGLQTPLQSHAPPAWSSKGGLVGSASKSGRRPVPGGSSSPRRNAQALMDRLEAPYRSEAKRILNPKHFSGLAHELHTELDNGVEDPFADFFLRQPVGSYILRLSNKSAGIRKPRLFVLHVVFQRPDEEFVRYEMVRFQLENYEPAPRHDSDRPAVSERLFPLLDVGELGDGCGALPPVNYSDTPAFLEGMCARRPVKAEFERHFARELAAIHARRRRAAFSPQGPGPARPAPRHYGFRGGYTPAADAVSARAGAADRAYAAPPLSPQAAAASSYAYYPLDAQLQQGTDAGLVEDDDTECHEQQEQIYY